MAGAGPTVGWSKTDRDGLHFDVAGVEDRFLVRAVRYHRSNFSRIVDRYHDSVKMLIQRICGTAESDDLAQEVFIRAFCNFDTFEFRDEHSLRTWLHRIAVNTAINALHSRERRRKHETFSLDEDIEKQDAKVSRSIPDTSGEPCRITELTETRRLVCDAIRALPPKHRQVLVLIDLQNLQYSEAAAIMGCRMGTVKSRLTRARKSVAATLQKHESPASSMPVSSGRAV